MSTFRQQCFLIVCGRLAIGYSNATEISSQLGTLTNFLVIDFHYYNYYKTLAIQDTSLLPVIM